LEVYWCASEPLPREEQNIDESELEMLTDKFTKEWYHK